jgi:hypothetical protein
MAKFLYQEPEYSGQGGVLRAINGTGYGRIWDAQLVDLVEHHNQDGRWSVPTPFRKGKDAGTASTFVVDKRSTTLYASDRDVFIFLVDENRPIEVGGQMYFRGFYTSNSEVGKAVFEICTFLYSYVCANRIIWDAREVKALRLRHSKFAPDRFAEQAFPALAAVSEASAQPIIDAIQKAKDTRIAETVADVEKWLVKQGFGKAQASTAVQLAAQGGDTGSSGDPTNLWDVVQGGTALARVIPHADARVAAERQWSSLLAGVTG